MIKVGVVGLGAMGQHHVRLYSHLDCELVGVADADPQRAMELGEKYHVKYYSDFHHLIDKVDAVSIAVPTTLHHSVAVEFLKEGVHCLVEKPIAFTLNEAEEMICLSQNNHIKLAVGHIERFNPAVIKLKELVNKGALGKILIISTRRVSPSAPRIKDVGIVIDSATHDIGVIRYLLNTEPINVFSRVGNLRNGKEDHAIIVLGFYGATACIEVNWFSPNKIRTLMATGSEGTASLDYIAQELKIADSTGEHNIDVVNAEPLRIELEDFLRSISEGTEPGVDGIEAQAILQIALESCRNNMCDLSALNKNGKYVGPGKVDDFQYHNAITR
jgi:UDP-N-acetylglucosamine 3-dehydrogenase